MKFTEALEICKNTDNEMYRLDWLESDHDLSIRIDHDILVPCHAGQPMSNEIFASDLMASDWEVRKIADYEQEMDLIGL
jgi:hypothetical protein